VTWQLIESDKALDELVERAASAQAVIIDTEFMRTNTFYPRVALVQLCCDAPELDSGAAWLIDPLAIEDPAPLAALLARQDVTKVVHSASEDLEVFRRWLGVLPEPLFDTQRAAALLDIGFGMGFRALVQTITGIELDKGETRSDWLRRPLTQSQCEYAAQDVLCLFPVWRELQRRCLEQNKLDWVLADSAAAVDAARTDSSDYPARIKGAWKLHPRQLAALSAICRWREDTARSRDKPRNWIVDDRACLQLAQHDPHDLRELADVPDLPSPVVRRYGRALLDLLVEQREMPESALPEPLPEPLDADRRQQVKKLRSRAREIAAELAVAPEALLQARDYELLLREGSGEAVSPPPHWQGWRDELVLRPLRRSLVVTD